MGFVRRMTRLENTRDKAHNESMSTTVEEIRVKDHMPREHAMAVARRIAGILRAQGAGKVLLFGSLCTPSYDPDYSDIDVYYEGIPLPDTLHAEVEATWEVGEEDESGRCRVDIVHEHTRDARFKSEILASGIPL